MLQEREDLDDYGWLNKEEDCPTPYLECKRKECYYYDACYIRMVEEKRKEYFND